MGLSHGGWRATLLFGVLGLGSAAAGQDKTEFLEQSRPADTDRFAFVALARPQQDSQAPAPQEKPPEKKDDDPNPAQVVIDKTKDVTVQAAQAAKSAGTATFNKARDWESSWIAGGYVGKDRKLVALTGPQRQDLYLRQTFTTISPYLKKMFAAGIDQARGIPREWGGGWGGYSRRFASREGQFFASNSIAAWGNAKLGYEPRYDQCRCSGFGPRLRHAMVRNFITYDRTETRRRPQWALYAGAFGGGVISTAWKPHPRNAFAEGGRAVLGQAGYGIALNIFTEFARDLNRKIGGKR